MFVTANRMLRRMCFPKEWHLFQPEQSTPPNLKGALVFKVRRVSSVTVCLTPSAPPMLVFHDRAMDRSRIRLLL